MTTTWNKDTVREKIVRSAERFGSCNPQQLAQLEFGLQRTDPAEVFYGILSVFVSATPDNFDRQQLAGMLLFAVRPKAKLEPYEMLKVILPNYNLSIEEVPWYLIAEYGYQPVVEALKRLETESRTAHEKKSASTMLWWSRRYTMADG